MSQPDVYTPAHSFTADSANIPDFPGQNLDVEFAALATILAEYHTNIALIQRDDGALKNGVVTPDSLNSTLTAAIASITNIAASVAAAAASAAVSTANVSLTHLDVVSTHADAVSTATNANTAAAAATAAAASASALSFKFTWSTNTVSSDPTSGTVKVNNSSAGSATALYISETDASGNALAAEIARWDDPTNASGRSRIKIAKDATNFLLLSITSAITDNGSWDSFTVSGGSLTGTLANGDTVYVQPVVNGSDGTSPSGMTNHGVPIASSASAITSSVVLTDGQLVVGQTGADPLAKTVSGDATMAASGALTVTKSSGSTFGTAAFQNVGVFAQTANNLSDLASASAARTNLGVANITIPGGRLTLTSATPVLNATVSGATTAYYALHQHDKIPIYSGTDWVLTTFTELSQATTDTTKSPAAVANNSNYDVFVWNDSSTIRATRGPAWTSDTARGTGAGTTELQRLNGVWTNKIAITNGPAANRGTYVGTIRSNGSASIDYIFGAAAAGGTAAVIGVWNMFNRVVVETVVNDTTASWAYRTTTWRAANNSNTNRVSCVRGLDEDAVNVAYCGSTDEWAVVGGSCGVALDSTSATPTGTVGHGRVMSTFIGEYPGQPGLGFHYFQAMEYGSSDVSGNWLGLNTTTKAAMGLRARLMA